MPSMNYLTLLIFLLELRLYRQTNNVCKNVEDYKSISNNKNCWYNPDVGASTTEIVGRYGYPLEEHEVTTDDGYILILYRIPRNNSHADFERRPIFIHHGIGSDSSIWVKRGRASLAFRLVNNGYDVWLANLRGAGPSTRHHKWFTSDKEYWDFSLDEIAANDLPAALKYISEKTGKKRSIIYIGYSMGATMSYMYATEMQEHAGMYLKGIISLAPAVFLNNMGGKFWHSAQYLVILENYLLGTVPFDVLRYLKWIIAYTCSRHPGVIKCADLLTALTGFVAEQRRGDAIPLLCSPPASTSSKVIKHYTQIMKSGRFQKYDYGKKQNVLRYNSELPQEYNLSRLNIPVALFVGLADYIASPKDAVILYGQLKPYTNVSIDFLNLSHNDFVLGRSLEVLYRKLLSSLEYMNKT